MNSFILSEFTLDIRLDSICLHLAPPAMSLLSIVIMNENKSISITKEGGIVDYNIYAIHDKFMSIKVIEFYITYFFYWYQ